MKTPSKTNHGIKRTAITAAIILMFLLPASNSMADRRHTRHDSRHYGKVVGGLPSGHITVQVGRLPFFYCSGVFYKRGLSGFFVVPAPIGAIITSLPIGFSIVIADRNTYFYYNDVYYKRVPSGYVVVDPPTTAGVIKEAPSQDEQPEPIGNRLVVNTERLNVRSGPGENFDIMYEVLKGDSLEVLGNSPGWVYVKLPSGKFGWVQVKYTEPENPPAKG